MTEELLEDAGGELERLAPLVHIEIGRKHKRPMCLSCNRPASVCWCCAVDSSALRGVRCRVVVLQHPHEEKRCLRTAPMLENALPHCSVLKGKRFSPDVVPELVSPDSIVLFPGADAAEVDSLATVAERGRPYNLIVIDGTWHQARAIMHKTKELRALPKVLVRSPVVSHYVIRTQPSDAAVSTVECAALALAVLEDSPHIYTTLVRPLTTLCQHQLLHGAVVHQSKEHRYREADAPSIGKRTAKTLAQCGATLSTPSSKASCSEKPRSLAHSGEVVSPECDVWRDQDGFVDEDADVANGYDGCDSRPNVRVVSNADVGECRVDLEMKGMGCAANNDESSSVSRRESEDNVSDGGTALMSTSANSQTIIADKNPEEKWLR